MPEKLTLKERLLNRLFAVPAIAQWWAGHAAQRTASLTGVEAEIPFAPIDRRLDQMRLALITTGGVHLTDQPPFDMENPLGDPSFREIPVDTPPQQLTITHKYYDHTAADSDLNVIFPLELLRELADQGIIGGLAPRHFGFMGHIDGDLISNLIRTTAPAVAGMLKQDRIDAVLLTPA